MNAPSSSQDLHPTTGARFVFDREPESEPEQAPRYLVTIYLPGTQRWSGQLTWVDGRASLAPTAPGVAAPDSEPWPWALAEALKLARVLHRDPKQHMVRWRG
ncbi:hypothetical protein DB30_03708 [Enhygromyxa salina]|uniref:Uncharacterized protein n=1 Tax=Enhygromyxa salina TaxID=215803 RepID=A0A0C2D1I9_9BACT|nr:hypothetical protein [Enhygromyxa salina]KIG17111.1 hypothetical protein DB30_03708 [Enhygromyxa salina]